MGTEKQRSRCPLLFYIFLSFALCRRSISMCYWCWSGGVGKWEDHHMLSSLSPVWGTIKKHGAQCDSKLNSNLPCFSPPKSKNCGVKILLSCPSQDSSLYGAPLHVWTLFHACRIFPPTVFSKDKSLGFYHHQHHLQKFHSRALQRILSVLCE